MREQSALARGATPNNHQIVTAAGRPEPSPEMQAFALELAEQIDFSRRLRELRRALGLTQAEVGEIIDEHQSEVSRLERGEANPSVSRANQVLEKLGQFAATKAVAAAEAGESEGVTARRVAEYLLVEQDKDDNITNLKLQKLLYYAQGYALALLGHKAFPERVMAWEHGPVVSEVYAVYANGRQAIPRPASFDKRSLDVEMRELLDHVYAKYGQYEAWKLAEMTHEEAPWKGTPQNAEITGEALTAFFGEILGRD
jgi:uncharacterized phage-associated protein/ribosome-binding protein aMBF1 (putative translation factor)